MSDISIIKRTINCIVVVTNRITKNHYLLLIVGN